MTRGWVNGSFNFWMSSLRSSQHDTTFLVVFSLEIIGLLHRVYKMCVCLWNRRDHNLSFGVCKYSDACTRSNECFYVCETRCKSTVWMCICKVSITKILHKQFRVFLSPFASRVLGAWLFLHKAIIMPYYMVNFIAVCENCIFN